MPESTSKPNGKRLLSSIFTAIGGVSGLTALVTLAVFGGELKHEVANHEARLESIEAKGSPAIQSHIEMDKVRDDDLANRMGSVEQVVREIARLQAIEAKLDTQSKALDELKSRTQRIEERMMNR